MSRFESWALVAVGFGMGLMPALAALLLGQWHMVQVVGLIALAGLPVAIWRGWFAGRRGGGDAG